MGTETSSIFTGFLLLISARFVKLNNPLMGTETVQTNTIERTSFVYVVKLNNPLMGTETCYIVQNCKTYNSLHS